MITGERIKRKLKGGGIRIHDYYRCDYYRCANNDPDSEYPSVRWRADDLEDAIVADLARLRIPDDEVANGFRSSLQVTFSQIGDQQRKQRMAFSKRRSELSTMNDRLLNAFLASSIDEPTFNAKLAALRDAAAQIEERRGKIDTLKLPDVRAALAVFEFSQNAPICGTVQRCAKNGGSSNGIYEPHARRRNSRAGENKSPSTFWPKGSFQKIIGTTRFELATS